MKENHQASKLKGEPGGPIDPTEPGGPGCPSEPFSPCNPGGPETKRKSSL